MTRRLSDVLKNAGIAVRENVQAAPLFTMKTGGTAALLIEPACKNELILAVRILHAHAYPYEIIGKGSNVLLADGYVPVALIRTVALDALRFTKTGVVADAGVSLIALSVRAAHLGFADLAFACGIPGTLGGALFMNAGAYGSAISDVVERVVVYCPDEDEIKTLFNDELNYSYRNSVFQRNNWVILSAVLTLTKRDEPAQIFARMRERNAQRRETQPLTFPSAGSVFRRPAPDMPLSAIMDEIGCKGMRIGDAAVSEKHAGFIINCGAATTADVKTLIECLANKLEKERGIRPHVEVRFIPRET